MHAIRAQDHGYALRRLGRVCTLRFGDQVLLGNATAHQVVVTDPAFAETRIFARSPRRDDQGRDVLLKEVKGVIETRAVDRRRTSVILSRAEDDDGVGGVNFLEVRLVNYAEGNNRNKKHNQDDYQQEKANQPVAVPMPFDDVIVHPWAKNSEISWEGMAPSRITFQRASGSVRSTIVEAISRGEAPPSTMMEMRSCS